MMQASNNTLITSKGNIYPYFSPLIIDMPIALTGNSPCSKCEGRKLFFKVKNKQITNPASEVSNPANIFEFFSFSARSPWLDVNNMENTYSTVMPPAYINNCTAPKNE